MNWVLVPVRNNFHLTRKAIDTFLAQDIGSVRVMVVNNDSGDGLTPWLWTLYPAVVSLFYRPPLSVAASWNRGLDFLFGTGTEYVLVSNNDVELRPDTFRRLVDDSGGFVTAVGVDDPKKIQSPYSEPDPSSKRPHPDFSCFLIRRETWEKVGLFDENFKIAFCEDWDYHVRLHWNGIAACCLDLPFFHHSSATVKSLDPAEQKAVHDQAERNREYFCRKWGMKGGSAEYEAFFKTSFQTQG